MINSVLRFFPTDQKIRIIIRYAMNFPPTAASRNIPLSVSLRLTPAITNRYVPMVIVVIEVSKITYVRESKSMVVW